MGSGLITPCSVAWQKERKKEDAHKGISMQVIIVTISGLGFAIFPLVLGACSDWFGFQLVHTVDLCWL